MSKYDNRFFVMLPNEASTNAFNALPDSVRSEINQTSAFFTGRKFSYTEWLEVTAGLIKLRPGFGSKGGSDYSILEAKRRFSEALKGKFGLIHELK